MSQQQYLRRCNLLVGDDSGNGLDLSNLRIKFAVKKTDGQTPNTASIRVYGLASGTANQIEREFSRVLLQAGYETNYGVIFQGDAKRIRQGRENGTDVFLDIQAADGDAAYNFAVVNATLAAGATQRDQIAAAAKAMAADNVALGYIGETPTEALPRGKVLYGPSREYLRQSAETSSASWSIQDGVVQFVPNAGLLPGTAVVLNARSGLVGVPEQTNDGIKFRCLLNPQIRMGAALQINSKDILAAELDAAPAAGKEPAQPATIAADGIYRVITLVYAGDTRGNDWYCEGVGLAYDETQKAKK